MSSAESENKRSLRRDRSPHPESLLLTVTEAAAELRLSPMTVYVLVEQGELPAVRYGRAVRIPREALILLIRASLRDQAGFPALQA